MRRLIAILKRLRLRWHDQHIADLEQRLSDLVSANQAIEAEISATAIRLLDARQARRAIDQGKPMLPTVDDQFPDTVPRSY